MMTVAVDEVVVAVSAAAVTMMRVVNITITADPCGDALIEIVNDNASWNENVNRNEMVLVVIKSETVRIKAPSIVAFPITKVLQMIKSVS